MSRRVHQNWRREVVDGTVLDWLLIAVEFVLTDAGDLSTWNLTVRLERGGGKPLVREGLSPRGSISIRHAFRNHIEVIGTFDVIFAEETVVIWANLQYGFDRDPPHYFEGVLAELPTRAVPTPAPAPPLQPLPAQRPLPQPPDALDPEPPIVVPAGEDGDLFPYTYLRCWPDPSADQLAQRFTFYPFPLDRAPTGAFLQQLAAARAQAGADTRAVMQTLAVNYLEGTVDSEAPFLDSLEGLPGAIASYRRIYDLLALHDQREPDELVAEIWRLLGMNAQDTARYLASDAHVAIVVRLWQSYLALIIELGFDRRGLTRLIQALIVEHTLVWLTSHAEVAPDRAVLGALARAVAVLPDAIFPLPPAQGSPPLASPPTADGRDADEVIVPYAIGELLMVKHSLRGYALGELASIENLRAGERRESTRRQLDRTVESAVQTRADDDVQDRSSRASSSSLTSEALGTLADTMVTTTYNNFGTSYGPPTTATLSGGWTVEQKPAGNPSKEDLTRFAREVLSKTVHRIAHRVAEVRSRSSLRDSEETVTSVVDNSTGAHNRRAVYRWLNEIYAARVVNYGNRLLVEMILRAPAAHLIETERAPGLQDREPPLPLAALGIESFEDISRHNFPALLARYPGDDLEMPPPSRRVVSASLRGGEARSIELPDGYQAVSASLGYAWPADAMPVAIEGVIGRQVFQFTASTAGVAPVTLHGEDSAVQVIITSAASLTSPPDPFDGPLFSIEIETAPSDRTMDGWRLRTFQSMQRSYAAQRQGYQRATEPQDARIEAVRPHVSARSIEHKELKHGAIDLLFSRLQSLLGATGSPVPGQAPSELELAWPRYLRFFDSAFEWREMTYSFMSSRHTARPHPFDPAAAQLAERFADDDRFREFLEATYARVLVPVTLAHAPALLFFLSSGALWDLPDRHVATHSADVALVHEINQINQRLGTTHEHGPPRLVRELAPIRVPTSLSVLTDSDVPLLIEGAGAAGHLPDAGLLEFYPAGASQ